MTILHSQEQVPALKDFFPLESDTTARFLTVASMSNFSVDRGTAGKRGPPQ